MSSYYSHYRASSSLSSSSRSTRRRKQRGEDDEQKKNAFVDIQSFEDLIHNVYTMAGTISSLADCTGSISSSNNIDDNSDYCSPSFSSGTTNRKKDNKAKSLSDALLRNCCIMNSQNTNNHYEYCYSTNDNDDDANSDFDDPGYIYPHLQDANNKHKQQQYHIHSPAPYLELEDYAHNHARIQEIQARAIQAAMEKYAENASSSYEGKEKDDDDIPAIKRIYARVKDRDETGTFAM